VSRWQICSTCDGEGKHSNHLGAFTGADLDQEDDEFLERYMGGDYDRPCERCDGEGKVLIDARCVVNQSMEMDQWKSTASE
jgi:RecJ-like exonuclease